MKLIKFSGRLVVAALGFLSVLVVPSVFAADTHDYSTYIRLKTLPIASNCRKRTLLWLMIVLC